MTTTTANVSQLSAQEAPVDTSWMGIGDVIAPKIHGAFEVDVEVVRGTCILLHRLTTAHDRGNS